MGSPTVQLLRSPSALLCFRLLPEVLLGPGVRSSALPVVLCRGCSPRSYCPSSCSRLSPGGCSAQAACLCERRAAPCCQQCLSPNAGLILQCDGLCMRSFHTGMNSFNDEEKFDPGYCNPLGLRIVSIHVTGKKGAPLSEVPPMSTVAWPALCWLHCQWACLLLLVPPEAPRVAWADFAGPHRTSEPLGPVRQQCALTRADLADLQDIYQALKTSKEPFKCPNCMFERHQCFKCKKTNRLAGSDKARHDKPVVLRQADLCVCLQVCLQLPG